MPKTPRPNTVLSYLLLITVITLPSKLILKSLLKFSLYLPTIRETHTLIPITKRLTRPGYSTLNFISIAFISNFVIHIIFDFLATQPSSLACRQCALMSNDGINTWFVYANSCVPITSSRSISSLATTSKELRCCLHRQHALQTEL